MDVNVKNIDPDVVARLAEQAAAEGMSQQEWIRQTLRRSASRLSPAELTSGRRHQRAPMSEEEFGVVRRRAAANRESVVGGFDARQPRR